MGTAARLVTLAAFAVGSVVVVAGCGGRAAGQDLIAPNPDPTDPTDPSDPTDPTDPNRPCATIAPACDRGDSQFVSDTDCKASGSEYCYTRSSTCNGNVAATITCGRPKSQCEAYPACDEGDTQTSGCPKNIGASCYTRTLCGTTIQCVHYEPTCDGMPSCDPGSTQVPAGSPLCSNPGYSCYSRTVCGTTITCAKKS